MRKISDNGDLSDPAATGERLGLAVEPSTTDGPINADCSVAYGFASIHHTTVSVLGESWFRAMPPDAGGWRS